MSNENSNLRVGSAGAGLFVGSTEILGGINNDIMINQQDNSLLVIINNSSSCKRIIIYVDDNRSEDLEIASKEIIIRSYNESDVSIVPKSNMNSIHYNGAEMNDSNRFISIEKINMLANEFYSLFYWDNLKEIYNIAFID